MGAASDGQEIVRLSKEHAEMKPVADAVMALARTRAEMADLEAMAADPEMAEMAAAELQTLKETLPDMERDVALLLAPRDADENASAVLEVRAGTGGDEAALFAGDLFRMYSRYASTRGWRVELDSATEGDAGGYKEIIATVTGDGVFGRLKFESGVHRVQRVPTTEAGGRIHTSAARRPARQQDRFRRPHYPLPLGDCGDLLGEVAARQPRQGDEEPARPPL